MREKISVDRNKKHYEQGKIVFIRAEIGRGVQENRQHIKIITTLKGASCCASQEFTEHMTLSRMVIFQLGLSWVKAGLVPEYGLHKTRHTLKLRVIQYTFDVST